MVMMAAGGAPAAQDPAPHAPAPGQQVTGFYVGTLPCADCAGIRTELTLLSDGAGRASYWLKETYLGKPPKDATFESGGGFQVEPAAYDAKAQVYRLTEARSSEKRFFLRVSDDELRALDRSGQPIASKLDYSLKRVP
jgi:uncharacterized lipoprotein NlpE involved in copper resistance